MDPKLVAVSVESAALSHALLAARAGLFPQHPAPDGAGHRPQVRKAARRRRRPGRLAGFALRASTGAPILADAAAWLECELRQQLDCGSHTLFVGEVVGCGGEGPDGLEVLRMEDTRMSYGG